MDGALGREIADAVHALRSKRDLLDLPLGTSGPQRARCFELLRSAKAGGSSPWVVGVFANQPAEQVNALAEAANLDFIQLSGHETEALPSQYVRPLIKAAHVGTEDTEASLAAALGALQPPILLLDTKDAKSGELGGTGKTFDWSVAAALASSGVPFFLAGGLGPENVAQAVEQVRPAALDISSGVETDGAKDLAKIAAFIAAANC